MKTYRLFEDNGGNQHLAVLNKTGQCVYYLADNNHKTINTVIDALHLGGDPIADGWEGGEDDPQACYEGILHFVEARNGGAWELI